jgi:hypothetical protein
MRLAAAPAKEKPKRRETARAGNLSRLALVHRNDLEIVGARLFEN